MRRKFPLMLELVFEHLPMMMMMMMSKIHITKEQAAYIRLDIKLLQ